MDEPSCPGCRALLQRVAQLEARVADLTRRLEAALRAGKRQAAPFRQGPPKPDPKTQQAKPLSAVYEVIIPVDNADLTLQPGLRGFAKIDGGHSSLGWWLWRLITKTFHFTL